MPDSRDLKRGFLLFLGFSIGAIVFFERHSGDIEVRANAFFEMLACALTGGSAAGLLGEAGPLLLNWIGGNPDISDEEYINTLVEKRIKKVSICEYL